MNVVKQDAMDDKITERCRTCEKQCMQENLDRLRRCRATIKQKPTSMDRRSVKELSRGQKVSRSINLAIERCRDCDKKKLKTSTDKPGVERCRASVEVQKHQT